MTYLDVKLVVLELRIKEHDDRLLQRRLDLLLLEQVPEVRDDDECVSIDGGGRDVDAQQLLSIVQLLVELDHLLHVLRVHLVLHLAVFVLLALSTICSLEGHREGVADVNDFGINTTK